MSTKIRSEHTSRKAIVYLRQSTLMQVMEHKESTERQYKLQDLAKRFGWDDALVQVLDEDLGQSGASTENRSGFQKLAAEVSLGKVGAVFSLEVSRLSRSSADWHRLLDHCALSDTLIIDDDGVYDPNDFNDRLVLGMKGTMSDAERHMMRLRLMGGKLHKAKKGEHAFKPPTGYVFENNVLVFDPDEQVQKAVRLLFERFRIDGSAFGVVRYFVRQGLQFPSRHAHKAGPAEMVWRPLGADRVISILKNPAYAGAYAYGRSKSRHVLIDGARRTRQELVRAREDWHAFIRDAHEGYISWQDHLENLKRLDENAQRSSNIHRRSVPRSGEALLQGLALCGKCGRRMTIIYAFSGKSYTPRYSCARFNTGGGRCWTSVAHRIDEKVATVFLDAIAPPELDLSLAVTKEVERQASDVDKQWKLRLERARYEALRAERQYNAVEPENRVIARTLETRWNDKAKELMAVEREYEEARAQKKLVLSPGDKKSILALAKDLPKLWNEKTLTNAEKKQILRLLIQDVVLQPIDLPKRSTKIQILWKTGATTEAFTDRPRPRDKRTPVEILDTIRELTAKQYSDRMIAEELSRRGKRNLFGRPFSSSAVSSTRLKNGIPCGQPPRTPSGKVQERDDRGRYSVRGLCARYDVTVDIVFDWMKRGVVTPNEGGKGRPFWFELTPEIEARIAEAKSKGYGPRRPGKRNGGRLALPVRFEDGRYSTRGLIEKFDVSDGVVKYWLRTGIISPDPDSTRVVYRFQLTPEMEERIAQARSRGYGPRRPGGRNGGRFAEPLVYADGRYSTHGIMSRYGVGYDIVCYWRRCGVIAPDADSTSGHYRYRLTSEMEARIAAALSRSYSTRRANNLPAREKSSVTAAH
jgi:DNA invertase Pin-like site-specific DNA recombinase